MTRITILVDKSGSMGWISQETIEGFNDFLEDQKARGRDAKITVRLFDDTSENIYSGNIMECPKLDHTNYAPQMGTAMFDSIGDTLTKMMTAWQSMQDKQHMIFAILTDGEDTSSRRFSLEKVKDLIARAKSWGWQFIFLGAGGEMETGLELGIEKENVLDFQADPQGVKKAFQSISQLTSQARLRLESK